jgi:Tfx family DNA-binding protein
MYYVNNFCYMYNKKFGLLSELQVEVLKLRAQGLSYADIAKKLNLSRAYVAMLELRAKRKIEIARKTLEIVSQIRAEALVKISKGTRLADIPSIVLKEADRRGIHLETNIIEIIRMVKLANPPCLEDGKTIRDIIFKVSPEGRLFLV